MPTVPSLEAPQVQQEPLPGRPYPRLSDEVPPGAFGADVGRGVEDLSSAVVGEQVRQKNQNDQLRVIDANTQLETFRDALLYGQDGKGGAYALHGQAAMDMPNRFLPQFDQAAQRIAATLTPDQQRLFARHSAAVRNEVSLGLNRYEYEEGNRLAGAVYSNGLKQAVEGASVGWRDPAVIGKARADVKALIQMQGDREGWNDAQRNEEGLKWLGQLHYSVVDRQLADGKPRAALQYFVGTKDNPGVRDSGELTGEQSHALGAQIDAAMRQQQAQAQGELAARVADVRAAAANGLLVPPGSMPSKSELQGAFPDTWQRIWSGMQRDIQMGADVKSLSTLTPQQIAARVEGYRPTQVEGAAEALERYAAVSASAQRVMAQRAADPRQYAIDNKLGSNALNYRDPPALIAELKNRLANTAPLSQQLGGYVPPLTRDEVTHFQQMFANQTPADRLRFLSQLNAGVDNDRGYQDIMRQFLPGSPVTAIVGSQAGHTDPQSAPTWFDARFAATPADQVKVLHGEELLNPPKGEASGEKKGFKGAFPLPAENLLRQEFSSAAGDLFRSRPELADDYYAAFKGTYAALLADKGDVSGVGNSTLRGKALELTLGHLTSFNGQSVAVPQGMDPSRFESLVKTAVNVNALAQGAKAGFEDKIAGYQLRELGGLGSGRYELLNGNMPLARPDGKGPFVIDLRTWYGGRQEPDSPTVAHVEPPKPGHLAEPDLKAPPLHAGAAHHATHPSQAPTL